MIGESVNNDEGVEGGVEAVRCDGSESKEVGTLLDLS
jgi:hypothetical protein